MPLLNSPALATGSPNSSQPVALLVEDSAVNRLLLENMLIKEGFDIVVATNGREAVERFEDQSFDLVVMDIQMPIMDGLEATREIRKLEKNSGSATPIVAVTAGMDKESCLNAGMDAYLKKPFQSADFHAVLKQVCSG